MTATKTQTNGTQPAQHEHKTLWEALLAAQAEMPTLQKEKVNPAFRSKYAALEQIMPEVLPVLNRHGLIWTSVITMIPETGAPVLTYSLIHAATGEKLEATMPLLLAKMDSQGLGSAATYGRRYSIMAVLGLVAEEDDDGNKASGLGTGRSTPTGRVTAQPAQQTERLATAKQRGLINGKAGEKGLSALALFNVIRAATNVEPATDMSEEDAQAAVARWLDRLPAKHVDAILEGIASIDPDGISF